MFANIAPLLAGLGLFMLGMKMLEDALGALAGLPLRRFLRDRANTAPRGLVIGAAATAVLQSSTLVSLLVLAFVGAGIMQLTGAIGVIMGANIGTTLTTWLVAMAGYKLDLSLPALLGIAVGGVGHSLLRRGRRLREFFGLLLGIGLLLFGLDLMKSGVESQAVNFDVALFADWPLPLMALLGVVLTATIQSSTAAMMIALGALHGGIVDLPTAAAFSAGTGVGTTFTAVLGALGGSPDKKRVAAAHLGFNLFKASLAIAVLYPLLAVLALLPALEDPLLQLAAFHTSTNVVSIALLLPATGAASVWLSRRFKDGGDRINHYLHAAGSDVPEAGLEAVRREARRAIEMAIAINRETLRLPSTSGVRWNDAVHPQERDVRPHFADRYRSLKRLEGEIVEYVSRLQLLEITPLVAKALTAQLEAVRMAVNSAKAMKDIRANLVDLRLALHPFVDELLGELEAAGAALYEAIDSLDPDVPATLLLETSATLREAARSSRDSTFKRLYLKPTHQSIGEEELSTLLNVNRALYLSAQSLLRALCLHLLTPEAAEVVDESVSMP